VDKSSELRHRIIETLVLFGMFEKDMYRPRVCSYHALACRKYFMPTQATTTQTQAMTAVQTINAG
jgi:hypothetical protein